MTNNCATVLKAQHKIWVLKQNQQRTSDINSGTISKGHTVEEGQSSVFINAVYQPCSSCSHMVLIRYLGAELKSNFNKFLISL